MLANILFFLVILSGLATLDVIDRPGLVANSKAMGLKSAAVARWP